MKQMQADLVVVGAGPAGLSAAWEAGSRGLKVLVLEKMDRPGGVSGGGIGMFAVDSCMQKAMLLEFSVEEAYKLALDFTHNKADGRLLSEYLRRSASTIDWFRDMGAVFTGVVAYYEGAKYTWHMYSFDNELRLPELILKSIADGGYDVELRTGARALSVEKSDGVVSGLCFEENGEEIRVQTPAVIIAGGGCGGNRDWVYELSGLTLGKDLFTMDVSRAQGETLKLAWAAGAMRAPVEMDIYCGLGGSFGGPGGTLEHLQSFRQPNLMVNLLGERFMDEGQMKIGSYAANAVLRQPEHAAFTILTDEIESDYAQNGWDLRMNDLMWKPLDTEGAVVKAMAEEPGWLFAADSLEELAELTGIDKAVLLETVEAYNALCDKGRDDILFKDRRYLRPIRGRRFYAGRHCLNGYGTLGGIKTDWRTRALDENFRPIPGLYAAGNDINNLFGDTYPFLLSGNTSSFAYNTGRMAGEHAAAYVKQL